LFSRSISNAEFAFLTIEALAQRFMDFLVLIPSSMDANRNEQNYVQPRNKTLEKFVGNQVGVPGGTRKKRLVSHSNILLLKSSGIQCTNSATSTLVYKGASDSI
jgi:hypothetical protein